eukprot:8900131-Prorocentrum_lima.AAC.1
MPTLPALRPQLHQLDRRGCGSELEQHFHAMNVMFHSRTHEHNEIHAQADLALMYSCARQHP